MNSARIRSTSAAASIADGVVSCGQEDLGHGRPELAVVERAVVRRLAHQASGRTMPLLMRLAQDMDGRIRPVARVEIRLEEAPPAGHTVDTHLTNRLPAVALRGGADHATDGVDPHRGLSPLSRSNTISADGQRTESSSTCTSMLGPGHRHRLIRHG